MRGRKARFLVLRNLSRQLTWGLGRKDKNKDARRPLLRPIICICNDLYASSLTKLRQYARIIRFNRPADIHLTKRLKSICEMEGLRAESRALTTLVGIAKGDMRGCLNALQVNGLCFAFNINYLYKLESSSSKPADRKLRNTSSVQLPPA